MFQPTGSDQASVLPESTQNLQMPDILHQNIGYAPFNHIDPDHATEKIGRASL